MNFTFVVLYVRLAAFINDKLLCSKTVVKAAVIKEHSSLQPRTKNVDNKGNPKQSNTLVALIASTYFSKVTR